MRQRRSLSCCRCCFLLPKTNRGLFSSSPPPTTEYAPGGNVASVQYPPSFLFGKCNYEYFIFKVVSLICPRANKLKRKRTTGYVLKIPQSKIQKFFEKVSTAKSKPNNTFHAAPQKKKVKKMNYNQSSGVQKQQRAPRGDRREEGERRRNSSLCE